MMPKNEKGEIYELVPSGMVLLQSQLWTCYTGRRILLLIARYQENNRRESARKNACEGRLWPRLPPMVSVDFSGSWASPLGTDVRQAHCVPTFAVPNC